MNIYKKNIFLFFTAMLLCISLTGCDNEVKDDFKHFLNVDLLTISSFESEAIDAFNAISKENQSSETYYQKLYSILTKTSIPQYQKFVDALSKAKPTTNDVKQLHQIYLKGANKQLESFKLFKEGIEEKNEYKISEANRLLAESKTYMNAYLKSAIDLSEELDLKWR